MGKPGVLTIKFQHNWISQNFVRKIQDRNFKETILITSELLREKRKVFARIIV